jgi:flavodoxin
VRVKFLSIKRGNNQAFRPTYNVDEKMKHSDKKMAGDTPGRILIVYYSFSRTTERLAAEIARQTGGDLRPLVPVTPYAFDYNTAARQARMEIERGYCPKLISGLEPVDSYAWIFIGSPNWFKTFAPPVLSFLRGINLTGKTVIPFCTHGGGGFGRMETEIAKECPGAKMITGFAGMGSFTAADVTAWLEDTGMKP